MRAGKKCSGVGAAAGHSPHSECALSCTQSATSPNSQGRHSMHIMALASTEKPHLLLKEQGLLIFCSAVSIHSALGARHGSGAPPVVSVLMPCMSNIFSSFTYWISAPLPPITTWISAAAATLLASSSSAAMAAEGPAQPGPSASPARA